MLVTSNFSFSHSVVRRLVLQTRKNQGLFGKEFKIVKRVGLIYINDIVNDIESDINLFADDTSLIKIVENPIVTSESLQSDIDKIQLWADKWLVKFNPSKSESLIISRKWNKPTNPILTMSNVEIPSLDTHKHLGIYLSNNGSWDLHLRSITEKAWQRIGILRHLKYKLDRNSLQTIYFIYQTCS